MKTRKIPALDSLLELHLINGMQFDRAMESQIAEELAGVENETAVLFRLVVEDIVNESEIDKRILSLESAYRADPDSVERELSILIGAKEAFARLVGELNREHMEALVAHGLITVEQCKQGCRLRPTDLEASIDSPARALAALLIRGVVTEDQFSELKSGSKDSSKLSEAGAAIVREAEQICGDLGKQAVSTVKNEMVSELLIWGSWALLIIVVISWLSH